MRLRVVLLEGNNGVGQTRLLEEMRLFCAFRGMTFVGYQCTPDVNKPDSNQESIHAILRKAVKALRSKEDSAKPIFCDQSGLEGSSSKQRRYPRERTISEAVSFFVSLAQKNQLVIAFDDIDAVETEISAFLNLLAYRASEATLTLLLTKKTSEFDVDLVQKLDACVGDDFTRVRLPDLSEQDATELQFLERDQERQAHILQLSAGNPLFISEYCQCRTSFDVAPHAVGEATASTISRTRPETQAVLRALSVFRAPVRLETLAMLSGKDPCELEARLNAATHVGLVKQSDGLFEFTYPVTRSTIYASLKKKERVQLNRIVFINTKNTGRDLENVAAYAFEGEMFMDAGNLYRALADATYSRKIMGQR